MNQCPRKLRELFQPIKRFVEPHQKNKSIDVKESISSIFGRATNTKQKKKKFLQERKQKKKTKKVKEEDEFKKLPSNQEFPFGQVAQEPPTLSVPKRFAAAKKKKSTESPARQRLIAEEREKAIALYRLNKARKFEIIKE